MTCRLIDFLRTEPAREKDRDRGCQCGNSMSVPDIFAVKFLVFQKYGDGAPWHGSNDPNHSLRAGAMSRYFQWIGGRRHKGDVASMRHCL